MEKIAKRLMKLDGKGKGYVYELNPPLEKHKYVWATALRNAGYKVVL